jgi:predicted NACHT family NTPase
LGIFLKSLNSLDESIIANKRLSHRVYAGEYLIEDAICHFLNEAGIILILDGYDEIKSEIKLQITNEIEIISERQTANSKIIISCRSGDYHRTLRYFSICEICPLDLPQIKEIVTKWLKDPNLFFHELNNKPYYELANRPLFLGQLLLLFNQKGELPNTAADVYERIITLLIKKWDDDRNIQRKSVYSNFENEDKQKFLQGLSYVLTYSIKTKVFNRKTLNHAYLKIHKKYDLPKEDSETVADEIESHNGLVVKSFYDNYEF